MSSFDLLILLLSRKYTVILSSRNINFTNFIQYNDTTSNTA